MATLVLQLPARKRLGPDTSASDSAALPAELAYVLTPDGINITRHGKAAPPLLPKADSVVVVLADSDVSWHQINLPKAPASRLNSALLGVLEEQMLDDTTSLHLAVAPGAAAGQKTWVAATDRAWLSRQLEQLEKNKLMVDRVVPIAWPEDAPLGHFWLPDDADASAPMQLTWADAQGVMSMTVQGGLARQLFSTRWSAEPARWTAHPAVAAPAERWLGSRVVVQPDDQRLLQAMRSLWNLRQFNLAPQHRGLLQLRDAWRQFSSAAWRPARVGLVALVGLQLLGLNAWAWHQQRQINQKQDAMVALYQKAHPGGGAVIDAPVQMRRATERLRAAAGQTSEDDFEALVGAVAAAWPAGQAPMSNLKYQNNQLSFTSASWSDTRTAQLRQRLGANAWQVGAANGAITVKRAAAAAGPGAGS
jgi:general secretion pathway protein L